MAKADEHLGIVRSTFVSARALQEQDAKDLEKHLQKTLNKQIVFNAEVDETLKSGFIIKLGHMNIDASFKSRINKLKELFN